VLSNSGKRAAVNAARMAALGLPPSLYDVLVTSGEAAWHALRARAAPPYDRLGARCLFWSHGMPLLQAAARRGLPMVCANPDLVAVGGGRTFAGPGVLAQAYAEQGGTVHYVGKPHRAIYAHCLRLLDGLAAPEIVAVGDSLSHDIAGGAAAGLDTALISGGIHADRIPVGADPRAIVAAIAALAAEHGAAPRWAMPAFRW
jgi:ribonucleotide monophosphatase NagD (HAD superfamily)